MQSLGMISAFNTPDSYMQLASVYVTKHGKKYVVVVMSHYLVSTSNCASSLIRAQKKTARACGGCQLKGVLPFRIPFPSSVEEKSIERVVSS